MKREGPGAALIRVLGRSLSALLGSSTARESGSRAHRRRRDRTRARPYLRGADDERSSPGRLGAGATRDLTAQEIRRLRFDYAPHPDGDPDPGEVVWTWVPYVENDGRGKDRPVLVVARIDAETVAGCYLSTKHRDGFVSVGTGGWDSQGRESFLSPERVLRVSHSGMRREGHEVDRERFVSAVGVIAGRHGLRR